MHVVEPIQEVIYHSYNGDDAEPFQEANDAHRVDQRTDLRNGNGPVVFGVETATPQSYNAQNVPIPPLDLGFNRCAMPSFV